MNFFLTSFSSYRGMNLPFGVVISVYSDNLHSLIEPFGKKSIVDISFKTPYFVINSFILSPFFACLQLLYIRSH